MWRLFMVIGKGQYSGTGMSVGAVLLLFINGWAVWFALVLRMRVPDERM